MPELPSDVVAQLAAQLATHLSSQLAETRADLARFEGRMTARLTEMDNSVVVLADEVTAQDKSLRELTARFDTVQAQRDWAEQQRARQGRRWDKAREWMAYLTALGAVVWNVWQNRNVGGG